jgi:hypothetical protein
MLGTVGRRDKQRPSVPKRGIGRRLLRRVTMLALLILGGFSIYWYVAARQVSEGYLAWVAARQAEGWTISEAAPTLAGWPTIGGVAVAEFRIAGGQPDLPGGVSWQTDHLLVGLDLLHPDHVDVLASGVQRIGQQSGPTVAYTTELTRLRIPLRSPAPMAELTVRALRVGSDGVAVGAAHALITADAVASKARRALSVNLNTQEIVLPPQINWPLGRRIASLSAYAAVDGPIPPARGLTADARAWRDGGGAVQLRQIDLRWGPLDGSLSGTASLDQDLQPLASGTVRATNYAEALDVLAARRIIGADAALAAKAVLSLLASEPAGGGPAQVEIPFTIRDRVVAARGIPLVKLPALQWPSP